MRRWLLLACVLLAGGIGYFARTHEQPLDILSHASVAPPEPAPLCPWRDPERDLKAFFPQSDRYVTETHVLSGLREELTQALGRTPTGDEIALRLNRVYQGDHALGAVLTRRVKGEFGAIELVLAVNEAGLVKGVRLQRNREPQTTAEALESDNWLKAFVGKRWHDPWKIGGDLPELPPPVRKSGEAVLDGVRTILVLLNTSSRSEAPILAGGHH